ncbi:MAG TPA: zinc dependent phospholipase C family protein [Gemmatimonadales bacterium]|nr:zinc dependent phospholipase C family protein [Gemmatimonadales bacterium]
MTPGFLALALLTIALFPDVAYAWTPGTHVALGDAVLASLHLLPQSVADLLRAFPYDFLYGSIAADSSIAKKYAPVGRHCHSWVVGLEIYDRARDDDPLRAFGLGYLAHLSADAVAHNYFVPRQLAVTSSTSALGHSYWESRFETHLSERFSRNARELLLRDHSRSDAHLDRILSPTIFSTHTNRRIFRGMVVAADSESWQRVFHLLVENSRWDLDELSVARYLERSFDFIVDLLNRFDESVPYGLDPAGDDQLRFAKRVRRTAIQRGGGTHVARQAARYFGLPRTTLSYAAGLELPIYDTLARSDNI